MLARKICVVCGKEYIKPDRKDSRSVCSQKCYNKLRRREDIGAPISDEEFKKTSAERRRTAAQKNREKSEPEIYFKRDDPDKVCLCKHRDCVYMAKQTLRTCDYMLITGHMRGCPVKDCDKYRPGKIRRNTPFKL